jgi:hypothetical protein
LTLEATDSPKQRGKRTQEPLAMSKLNPDGFHGERKSMNIEKELDSIAKFHGLQADATRDIYNALLRKGASPEAAITAIRLGYAMHSGKHEYFSAKDISAAMGISEEEAAQMIEECPDKVTVHYPDWMQ